VRERERERKGVRERESERERENVRTRTSARAREREKRNYVCNSEVPPDPMNHVKIFKGWTLQDAPSKLVQLWYKSFPPGRFLPGGNEEANCVE